MARRRAVQLRSRRARLLNALGFVLLSPLILALLIIVPPIVVLLSIRFRARLLFFCLRFDGTVFLVAGRNRGWYDFIRNNVIPALPPDVRVLWYRAGGPRTGARRHRLIQLLLYRGPIGTKPLLVRVRKSGFTVLPVHRDLLPLKQQSTARDSALTDKARAILDHATA